MDENDLIVKTKVLIRASSSSIDNVLSFAFIHSLFKKFDRLELNILLDEGGQNVFSFLPFPINVYYVPKNKLTLLGIHHFSYNLTSVFNIDYFFDLSLDFKGAFFGVTFRAKKKIGFTAGFNKFLMTRSVDLKRKPISDSDYVKLLGVLGENNFLVEKVSGVRQYTDSFKDESKDPTKMNSYVMVVINELSVDNSKNKLWNDFFDCFVDEKFAIYVDKIEVGEEQSRDDRLRDFFSQLDGRNKYISIPGLEPTTLKTIIKESSYIVSDLKWFSLLCSYLGKHCYIFSKSDQYLLIEYFHLSPQIVLTESDVPKKLIAEFESRSLADMTELIDIIQRFHS